MAAAHVARLSLVDPPPLYPTPTPPPPPPPHTLDQGPDQHQWPFVGDEVEVGGGLRFVRPALDPELLSVSVSLSLSASSTDGRRGSWAGAGVRGVVRAAALEADMARLIAAAPACLAQAAAGQLLLQLAAGPGGLCALAAVRGRLGARKALATHPHRPAINAVAHALHANAARVVVERLRVARLAWGDGGSVRNALELTAGVGAGEWEGVEGWECYSGRRAHMGGWHRSGGVAVVCMPIPCCPPCP